MKVTLTGTGPVLVVDDNSDDLEICRLVFAESRIPNTVLLCRGGDECLAYMEKVAQQQEPMPAIILLDINMPGLNGFEVLSELRSRDIFKQLPKVITFTSSNDPADMERSTQAGSDAHVVKPWGLDAFADFVNSLIPQK